jgi:hypothetical protein
VAIPLHAQWVKDSGKQLDTLGIKDRVNIHTNAADWLILIPNLGVEYDVATNKNYNRWSVLMDVRYKWHTSHTFVPNFVYNIFEIKAGFRNYWRTRLINGTSVKAHKKIWDKAMSQRRYAQKHPLTTFYRGLYISYAKFSLCPGKGKLGREGSAIMAGVTYGFQHPLYRFKNGTSIDLDIGIDLGVAFANYHGYYIDKENNRFRQTGKDTGWRFMKFPVVNDIRAGFVYRLGKKQGFQKYHFRYDVDKEYSYRIDSLRSEQAAKAFRDSLGTAQFKTVYNYYQHQLDSIIKTTPKQHKEEKNLLKVLRKEKKEGNAENKSAHKKEKIKKGKEDEK